MNEPQKPAFLVGAVIGSDIAQFSGTYQTHIYSHSLEKVVCGSKSFHGCGINEDINIDNLKDSILGGAKKDNLGVSCKRCRSWFVKHYL
jgi:hypothetical protein